jgi:hypothetical protein
MLDKNLAPVCGLYCGTCSFYQKQCQGCGNVKGKPFWTSQIKVEICPLYDCSINKNKIEHCGLCSQLPCKTFTSFYDPSLSPEEAKKAVCERQNELIERKNIGTQKWLQEKEKK